MYTFSLEKEVEKLRKKYSGYVANTPRTKEKFLDFSIYESLIYTVKDKLITGRDHRLREDEKSYGDLPHSLYVFEIMMDLVFSEDCNPDDTAVGLTAALLHDIGYALLAERGDNVSHNFQEADMRIKHMKAGAAYVKELLKSEGDVYTDDQIQRIAGIIEVHDNPSVSYEKEGVQYKGIPLDYTDHVVYMHREADRMWMSSREGFDNDFRGRLQHGKTTPEDHVAWVVTRHIQEKELYHDDGNFLGGLLFRTPRAYAIFLENVRNIIRRYTITEVPPQISHVL